MAQEKSVGGNDAFSLFPDLMKNVSKGNRQSADTPDTPLSAPSIPPPLPTANSPIAPPPPPDISWLLKQRSLEDTKSIAAEQTALILVKGESRSNIEAAFKANGYRIEAVGTQLQAIEKVKSGDFAAIVIDENFAGTPLGQSPFHMFMQWLPMERRRSIHYTFVGPKANTLHGLEALCESVNLVVNESDTRHFDSILKKSLTEYTALFQPYIHILADSKKRSAH